MTSPRSEMGQETPESNTNLEQHEPGEYTVSNTIRPKLSLTREMGIASLECDRAMT